MLLASPGKKRNGQSVARAPYAIHKCYLQMWGLYTFAQEQYLILVEEDEGVALYPHQNGGGWEVVPSGTCNLSRLLSKGSFIAQS